MVRKESVVAEKAVDRSFPDKRNRVKVPKKIHKAEREKLKRDQLNGLFLELGNVLELTRQNNGKASILNDAIKILRDFVVQLESLRKENAVLIAEAQYVRVEKNELKDETMMLGAEVEKLHNELRERTQSNSSWRNNEEDATPSLPQHATAAVPILQATLQHDVGPVCILPLTQDLQHYPELGTEQTPPASPKVRRPQPRYPTPLDSWPFRLLSQQQNATTGGTQLSGTSS